MRYTDLRCAKCGTAVEPCMTSTQDDEEDIPPCDALLFLSYGNYGSRLFDSVMGDEYLLIIICDSCAAELREAGNVIHVTKEQPAVTRRAEKQERWRREGEEGTGSHGHVQ